MRRCACLTLAAAALSCASPALACRAYLPAADLSVLHAEVPAQVPSEAVVIEVQFADPQDGWSELREGSHAHVKRVLHGNYQGDRIIVRDAAEIRITCYPPIRDGGAGLIVGMPTGYENGVLVVAPIFHARGNPDWGDQSVRLTVDDATH